jgi:hypothetical protein
LIGWIIFSIARPKNQKVVSAGVLLGGEPLDANAGMKAEDFTVMPRPRWNRSIMTDPDRVYFPFGRVSRKSRYGSRKCFTPSVKNTP